jgi:zinc protease
LRPISPIRLRCSRALAAFAVLALAFTPAGGSTSGANHPLKPRISHIHLANELDVSVVENHAAPLAVVTMTYAIGSVDDPIGRGGVAHALEHMVFRGSRALSGAAEDDLDARLGIETNAHTDFETTTFHETIAPERLELAMRIEAGRMHGALLRASDWNVERGVVLAEIRSRTAARSIKVRDLVRAAVFAGTPYGRSAAGTPEDVARITIADLRRAYARGYAPANAWLTVTGDVSPERVFALARRIFGSIPTGRAMPAAPKETPRRTLQVVRTNAPGADTLVDIALESRDNPMGAESLAWELLDPAHEALSRPLVMEGPCSSYDVVDDTQSWGGMYHVICHLEPSAEPAMVLVALLETLTHLADRRNAATYTVARRAVRADKDGVPDDLESEADYFSSAFMEDDNPNPRYAASDAAIAAVLRRWVSPLAIGIVKPSRTLGMISGDAAAARTRSGDRPASSRADGSFLPAWAARELARPAVVRAAGEPPSWFALPNGVRLAVQRRAGAGRTYVRAGFEGANRIGRIGTGASHLAGSILASGTRRWPYERVTRAGDRYAISSVLGAESDLIGSAGDIPLLFDILADTWRAPRLDDPFVGSARRWAIREATHMMDDPDAFATRVLLTEIDDPAAPMPNPAAEQRRADTSVRAVRNFFRARVRPEHAWIAVVGDVDAVTVYRQALRAFGGWRVAAADPVPSPSPRVTASGVVNPPVRHVRVARPVTRVLLGARAPLFGDPDDDTMTLLDTLIAGAMETRLMGELRERRGLVYSVSSSYDDGTGRFIISFQCAPRDRAAATALLRRTLDDLPDHPPAPDELARARGKLLGAALVAQGSAAGMLDELAGAARRRTGNEDVATLDAASARSASPTSCASRGATSRATVSSRSTKDRSASGVESSPETPTAGEIRHRKNDLVAALLQRHVDPVADGVHVTELRVNDRVHSEEQRLTVGVDDHAVRVADQHALYLIAVGIDVRAREYDLRAGDSSAHDALDQRLARGGIARHVDRGRTAVAVDQHETRRLERHLLPGDAGEIRQRARRERRRVERIRELPVRYRPGFQCGARLRRGRCARGVADVRKIGAAAERAGPHAQRCTVDAGQMRHLQHRFARSVQEHRRDVAVDVDLRVQPTPERELRRGVGAVAVIDLPGGADAVERWRVLHRVRCPARRRAKVHDLGILRRRRVEHGAHEVSADGRRHVELDRAVAQLNVACERDPAIDVQARPAEVGFESQRVRRRPVGRGERNRRLRRSGTTQPGEEHQGQSCDRERANGLHAGHDEGEPLRDGHGSPCGRRRFGISLSLPIAGSDFRAAKRTVRAPFAALCAVLGAAGGGARLY